MIIKLICTNNNTRLILTRQGTGDRIHGSPNFVSQQQKFSFYKPQAQEHILFQYTTGMLGFKGATRSSIYGAEKLLKKFISRLDSSGLYSHYFILVVRGFSPTRNLILRRLAQLKIIKVKDITSYPHNGCRKKKSLRK